MSDSPDALPSRLLVRAWSEGLVETDGFLPDSEYIEACWLGLWGPTATWLYRRLGRLIQSPTGEVSVDTVDLALSLGLGHGTGRNSPLVRSLMRLVRYQAATGLADGIAVRRRVGPVPSACQHRLSHSALAAHLDLTGRLPAD